MEEVQREIVKCNALCIYNSYSWCV